MAEHESFLHAVLDNPDDDAPRLAYAAWCDEQPDDATKARAEFIRAEIRLHHMDIDVVRSGEGSNLQDRILELRRTFGGIWAGPLQPFVESFAFERGFVALVRLSARAFLDHAGELFASAPVRHVDLTRVRDVSEELFSVPHLARLRSLSMDRCGLYDIHLRLLAASPHAATLRWLSVVNNNLTIEAAEAIAKSPYLTQLVFVEMRGNLDNPTESLGLDGDQPIGSGLPQAGLELEARHGYLPWLHRFPDLARLEV